jgi:hypothetical protein
MEGGGRVVAPEEKEKTVTGREKSRCGGRRARSVHEVEMKLNWCKKSADNNDKQREIGHTGYAMKKIKT